MISLHIGIASPRNILRQGRAGKLAQPSAIRIAICAAAAGIAGLAMVPANARADGLNETLDFNNNQVPTGWTLGFENGSPGHNAAIVNQRFEVGPTDTYALLTKNVSFSPSTTAIQLSYTANAADDFYGMGNSIRLLDANNSYYGVYGPSHGGYGDPGVRMAVGYASGTGGPGASYFQGTFPADWGTYNVNEIIQNGQVQLTATKQGATTPIYSGTISVPQLQLSNISKVGISEFVTSGTPGWIDNVAIHSVSTVVTTKSPETSFKTPNVLDLSHLQTFDATNNVFIPSSTSSTDPGYINKDSPTIVLTHGWGANTSMWAGTNGLAAAIGKASPGANILAWDWKDDAGVSSDPSTLAPATYNTQRDGNALGNVLTSVLGSGYNHAIHFLGHSLGTLVDAQAINTLHAADGSVPITDTLFDEAAIAEISNIGLFLNQPATSFSAIPTAPASIDNYISAVGSIHSEAANVILTLGPTALDPVSFHSYPQQWYTQAFGKSAGDLHGLGPNYDGIAPIAGSTYWQHNLSNEFALDSVNTTVAKGILVARDGVEIPIFLGSKVKQLGIDAINGAIEVSGNVVANVVDGTLELGQNSTPQATLQLNFTKQAHLTGVVVTPADSPTSASGSGSSIDSASPSTSSAYAYVPMSIPGDAETMSFTFTAHGLSPQDLLSFGIESTSLMLIESQYLPDGTATSSGLIDISPWAGHDVRMFAGLIASDDANQGGTITIGNIEFESVPEPAGLPVVALAGLILMGATQRPNRTGSY